MEKFTERLKNGNNITYLQKRGYESVIITEVSPYYVQPTKYMKVEPTL